MMNQSTTTKPLLGLLALLACGSVTSQGGSLYLRGPVALQGVLHFTIAGGEPDGIYDFYWHHSLGATSGWVHLVRTAPGQTNFAVLPSASSANFFALGTQQDSDGDTLPDAYEELVLRTDAAQAHTAATLAAAGLNPALLDDAPSGIRTSQATQSRRWIDTWDPCAPFPRTQYQIHTTAWSYGRGGTNSRYLAYGGCEDGHAVTNFFYEVRLIWDTNDVATEAWRSTGTGWSAPEPAPDVPPVTPRVKYSWHLEAFPGGPGFLRTFDSLGEYKRELLTGGSRLSSQAWPWIIRGSATELRYGVEAPFETTTNIVPPTSISLAGTNLDATGTAVVQFRDNTTNDFTPVISGSITNYEYAVSAQKVKIALNFAGSGSWGPREATNGTGQLVGYQANLYDGVSNLVRTLFLGATNPPVNGEFFNFQQTTAKVPTNAMFDSGWMFHRDVQDKSFQWRPDIPGQLGIYTNSTAFTPGSAGEGAGNDPSGAEMDVVPDADRLIFNVDKPGITPPVASDHALPPGTVIARRFYAREWLTWRGLRVSPILRWQCFTTLRRKADYSWERAGPNVIKETDAGESETPDFTALEAFQIMQQP